MYPKLKYLFESSEFTINVLEKFRNVFPDMISSVKIHPMYIAMSLYKKAINIDFDELKSNIAKFASENECYLSRYDTAPGWLGSSYIYVELNKSTKAPTKIPRFLYHFTNVEHINDIKAHGLMPKSSTRNTIFYEPRVYFFRSIGKAVYSTSTYNPESGKMDKPLNAVVVVDTPKIPKAKFYVDIDMPRGSSVWTNSIIPPEAIFKVFKR